MSYGAHFLVNFELKNNLWISINDRYAWENGVIDTVNWKTDFDHIGFDWRDYANAFKWGSNNRYVDIAEFTTATGQEANGIALDYTTCLDSLDFTEDPVNPCIVDSFHLQYNTLLPSCHAVDAGVALPGINDGFTGNAPDLGAYETGQPLPHYGVRPRCTQTTVNTWVGPLTGGWYDDTAYWSNMRFPDQCDSVVLGSGALTLSSGDISSITAITLLGGAYVELLDGSLLVISHDDE